MELLLFSPPPSCTDTACNTQITSSLSYTRKIFRPQNQLSRVHVICLCQYIFIAFFCVLLQSHKQQGKLHEKWTGDTVCSKISLVKTIELLVATSSMETPPSIFKVVRKRNKTQASNCDSIVSGQAGFRGGEDADQTWADVFEAGVCWRGAGHGGSCRI